MPSTSRDAQGHGGVSRGMSAATARSKPPPRDGRTAVVTVSSVRWRMLLLPALSGAFIAAAFLDFRLYPLAWVAFVPLLWSLARARSYREALWLGVVGGLATNIPAFHWLVHTMHVFGGFPYPIAIFFYLCLSTYSAGQFVLFAAGIHRLTLGPLGLAAPVLWVGLEFLYPNLFPWRMANTQFLMPWLTQIGDVTGPFGLSFVLLWVNAGITLTLLPRRRWRPLLAAAMATILVLGYGLFRVPIIQAAIDAAPVVRVGLIQGNVGIHEKGDVARFDVNVDRYRKLSEPLQSQIDVLIWPESVAQWWVAADAEQLAESENPYRDLRTFLIFGGLAYVYNEQGEAERFNSAFLVDQTGRVLGRYDKQVLLPFGEYVPGASLIPALAELTPQSGDFTPGRDIVTLDVPGQVRFAPLICYEDVPSTMARTMTQNGAEALLTIFNDAWFGRSMAAYQHEALALWRAIENRRYFVRVGNAGVTGVVDPFGRVVDRLGLFTEEVLQADIRPLQLKTFYTRHGDVFAWMVVVVAGLWLWASPSSPLKN